jgi:tetratricopeptide (TPR) repeat protein
MSSDRPSSPLGKRLDTWKEIGAFFGRDERTAKRWENTRGLPVHRVPGEGRANVYAYTGELTAWLQSAKSKTDPIADSDTDILNVPESVPAQSSGEASEPTSTAVAPPPPAVHAPHHPNSRMQFLLLLAIFVAVTGLALVFKSWRPSRPSASSNTPRPSASHQVDPQAQDLYLKGIYYWHKRTPESLNQAVDFFTQAIVRDPNYAEAYVGLANCYNLLHEYSSMPAEESYPRAKNAAERAIALDDSLSAAHSSLAFVDFWGYWDATTAEKEFRRALALDPNSVPAHHWYATVLMCLGRLPESLREIDAAHKLDPQSISVLADRGLILYTAGQTQAGIHALRELENSDPDFLSPHKYLADIYLLQGDSRMFLLESKKTATLMRDDQRMALVNAGESGYSSAGQRGMLLAILKIEKSLYAQGKESPYELARTCALLDDKSQALEFLQIASAKHDPALLQILSDTAFSQIRPDPAFQSLLVNSHLPTT